MNERESLTVLPPPFQGFFPRDHFGLSSSLRSLIERGGLTDVSMKERSLPGRTFWIVPSQELFRTAFELAG